MFASRVRIVRLVFFTALLVAWCRVAYLQLALGPWHRATRAEVEVRTRLISAPRGTIRTADGTELARDRCDADLAVHYRYLERPLDESWLARQARDRLARRERRDPQRVEEAKEELRDEIETVWQSLTELTGSPRDELDRRASIVQRRVERIVESVNRRSRERWEEERRKAESGNDEAAAGGASDSAFRLLPSAFLRWLADEPAQQASEPVRMTVVEQDRYYTLVENISSDVLLSFTSKPERFPGVRLSQRLRREYPQKELACSVVGYIERAENNELAETIANFSSGRGLTGVEGFYDSQLSGMPGHVREQVAVGSGVTRALGGRAPQPGQDVSLTLDLRLQQFAEESLERALGQMLGPSQNSGRVTSGAIVVLDVHTGSILVAAATPRFDLNVAAQPSSDEAQELAARKDSPLFNRVVQMTLSPGSTFKPVTAVAALKAGIDPRETYFCCGYLHEPDKFRCLVFRNFGVGHETVTMHDALVRSCNVYFFHLSEQIGWEEIVRWGDRFGFGKRTGIDLVGEEPGVLRDPAGDRNRSRRGPTEGERLGVAIGQGSLVATPVQVAVMMAAIANGGLRVVPHVRRDAFQPPRPIEGIEPNSDHALAVIRHALEQVVADPRGTGHENVFLPEVEIAGKTGTAQSGSPLGDHAWFAGYVPAKQPRYAVVVVLEHAGSGGHAAGPLARQLVRRMLDQGYLSNSRPPAVLEASGLDRTQH